MASEILIIDQRKHVNSLNYMWALAPDNSELWSVGRKLATNVMATVRAGKTEPLQQLEAVLNIQHLLDDGGRNWFNHIAR